MRRQYSGYDFCLFSWGSAAVSIPPVVACVLFLATFSDWKGETFQHWKGILSSLGIPLPTLNAYFIGLLECFGSIPLIAGLASRPLSLLIGVSMVVAYITADFEAVSDIFTYPDKFVKADPFPFLLTALIIYVFGPGELSVDRLLKVGLKGLSKTCGRIGERGESPAKLGYQQFCPAKAKWVGLPPL